MTALSIQDLTVRYGSFSAVKSVSLDVQSGSTLGIAGESGSGKSTVARAIVGLAPIAGGRVTLDGRDLRRLPARSRRRVQMIFQNSTGALDPRMTASASISEALPARTRGSARSDRVRELLDLVRLDQSVATARPIQLSGGQRQRVAIARALAAEPEILVADEITSALDVSVQASILNLLRDLHATLGMTLIFISHNLAAVRYISARVAVMYLGEIAELAPTHDLFSAPKHPYSAQLLNAVPSLTRARAGTPDLLDLDVPDPAKPPSGCSFHPRCPVGPTADPSRTVCLRVDPHAAAATRPHDAACHFAE